jgi:acetyl-CoA carboxylase biotin carboxylase subunit
MGIETVAVYSTADSGSLHVRLADQAVCIGPPPSAKSYLSAENLIMAALHTGCEALHPGAGFLSENAAFARLCGSGGLVFIGPSPENLELLGNKVQARATARKYGLPVTPGTDAVETENPRRTAENAEKLGFPVIIKAAAGGGGKGMRIVKNAGELEENIAIARCEAEAHFADGTVFIEKYLENPRHVELQILSDGSGNVAVLGERDCTVQKNHQKLIEESPAPAVDPSMRKAMAAGAVPLFRELKYRGAGTIEFLVEDGSFYFMEVNARVQVEHPVSEFVSGVDIIREQILACTEGRMSIAPRDGTENSGWAIECRINALAPGRVNRLEIPGGPGVRFDSSLYPGCTVSPHYDSMVGKLIVHDTNREKALARMNRALGELVIDGIAVNTNRQRWIINHPIFRSGSFGTSYYSEIEKEVESVL